MLRQLLSLAFIGMLLSACGQGELPNDSDPDSDSTFNTANAISQYHAEGADVSSRFSPPAGFERVAADSNSFAFYLQHLPLKPDGSEVTYYNGGTKTNHQVYSAVVDLPIGTKNLHQCADAVMRLRAEYLWRTEQSQKIHFNFTNGFQVDYSAWLKGNRMQVNGNKTNWVSGSPRTNNYETFWSYMELVFNYAGTLSLSRELKSTTVETMKIGDVFIQGGSPGHAIIVIDMAENKETGEKVFMLAQSYMPAQETQILINPMSENSSWYGTDFGATLRTPEWHFERDQLKSFE